MAVGDIYSFRTICSAGAQVGLNVWHYVVTSDTIETSSHAAILAAFSARFAPLIKAAMSDEASFVLADIRRIFPLPPSQPVEDRSGAGVGGNISTILPRQVSGLITIRTPFAGRRYRGRKYIPFPAEVHNDPPGNPTAGYLAALQSIADVIEDSLNVVDGAKVTVLFPCLWHRDTSSYSGLTGAVVRNYWGTQRRRNSPGGMSPDI